MPSSALLTERIARHGLADRPCSSVAAAAALTCAIQAQDAPASRLGIRARTPTATDRDVLTAIEDDRSVVRTWLMRGTIHLVDTRDLRWLVRLIGPAVERKYRTRWRQIGLSDDVLDRSVAALPEILGTGSLTRLEIRTALAERGIAIESADPQAHTHAVLHASTTGLICRGAERGRDATFTLLDQWVPDAPAGPSGDDALAEIARRYFAAFSPATAADFTTWSGLGATSAIALIREELTAVDVDGRSGFRLGSVEPAREVRLLPAFDNYLVGYRNRDAILVRGLHENIYQGGMIRPAVLVDGRVVGSWALARAKGTVKVTLFETLNRAVTAAVEAEVDDVAQFLGQPLTMEFGALC